VYEGNEWGDAKRQRGTGPYVDIRVLLPSKVHLHVFCAPAVIVLYFCPLCMSSAMQSIGETEMLGFLLLAGCEHFFDFTLGSDFSGSDFMNSCLVCSV